MRRNINVLHLATDAYGGYGGVALYNRDVLEALCSDHEIGYVTSIARSVPFEIGALPEKLLFDVSATGGKAAYIRAVFSHLRDRPRYDVVYCSHINLAPIAWLAAKLLGIKWVLCIYGIDAWPAAASRRAQWFASRADLIISLSKVTLDRFRAWCPVPTGRTIVMPNAIHLEQFGIAPKNAALLERYGLADRKVVMTFGRLDPLERYKGFDEIISLMPEMLIKRPDLAYLIAGAGSDGDRLRAKAQALGVSERVIFTGMVDEAEKADTYRLADVYAMPSKGEGFGFVMLEAMACGIPAIGSNQDGTQEAVRGGMIGQVVDPDNLSEIGEAILSVIDQPKAVQDGLHHFAFPAFAERLQGAIKALIAR